MIYTITLNPALDYVIQVDHFETGRINRIKKEDIFFGGKGINVSCILKELDHPSCALGFIADFTGQALKSGLEQMNIYTDFVEVEKGRTRINVKMKTDNETEINGTGPQITDIDFQQLISKVKTFKKGDTLIISGNIPSSLNNDSYQKILQNVSNEVRIVVDAEKELLLKTLQFNPFLIKPNRDELNEMFNKRCESDDEIVECAKKLQEKGAKNVLVSMAGDGSILVDENGNVHHCGVAKGEVVNSVGAGDSMVAGFIAGYLNTKDYQYAQRLGTACGSATAFHSGLATKEQIYELLETLK